MTMVRTLLASAAALLCAGLAFGALRNLWGYRDSPTWIYVFFGSFWIVLSVACARFALKADRRRSR